MDLNYSKSHKELRAEVRAFLVDHGRQSPKPGGGRKRPGQKTLDWQRLLLERGYCARTVPAIYGGYGAEPDILEAAMRDDYLPLFSFSNDATRRYTQSS